MKKKILILVLLCFAINTVTFAESEQKTQPAESFSIIKPIERWYENNVGYGAITVLMAAESSILPVPSELVIPPAAYMALKEDSHLNIFLVILFGTIGALIGATVNYFVLGMWLGRAVLYRFVDSKVGHMLLLSGEKLKRAEDYFNKNGKISTFVGRFIPVVRHFISIPAGFSRMNYFSFATFTFIGAGLWNCCLALLGYLAHGQADIIYEYSHELSIILIVLFVLAVIYFVIKHFVKKAKNKERKQ